MSLQGRILADAPAPGQDELLERLAAAWRETPPPAVAETPAPRTYLIAGRPVTPRGTSRGAGGR